MEFGMLRRGRQVEPRPNHRGAVGGRRAFLAGVLSTLLVPGVRGNAVSGHRRPYVQNVAPERVTLRWTSLRAGEGTVMIRDARGNERLIVCESGTVRSAQTGLGYDYFNHRASIAGLEPGASYTYRLMLNGAPFDAEGSFRTAGPSACTFLAIGDTGTGSQEQDQLARRLAGEQADLLIHTGDIAYPTGQHEAYERRYFDFYHATMRNIPFYPCPGNHDYYETEAYPYLSIHDLPAANVSAVDRGRYYSFDWGDVHFISLDSNAPLTRAAQGHGEMVRWLERDLAATKKFWRIAFFHHPPFAFGPNSGDLESARVRDHVVPILRRYGVPLVLNGHEHSYQRTHAIDRTVYVTTGGGGAALYPVHESEKLARGLSRHHYLRAKVDGRTLALEALDATGGLIDETIIQPQPILAERAVVNAASFERLVGAGSLVSIFGWHLALDTFDNQGKPLPANRRSGVRVMAAGRELELLLVSPTQITAQLPDGVTGVLELAVSTTSGSVSASVEVAPVALGLFGAIVNAEGTTNAEETPGEPGSHVTLLVTGVPAGTHTITASVSGFDVECRVLPAGFAGVRSIGFQLPPEIWNGAHGVYLQAAGATSNTVTVWVR